jgi:hypothetical protein
MTVTYSRVLLGMYSNGSHTWTRTNECTLNAVNLETVAHFRLYISKTVIVMTELYRKKCGIFPSKTSLVNSFPYELNLFNVSYRIQNSRLNFIHRVQRMESERISEHLTCRFIARQRANKHAFLTT